MSERNRPVAVVSGSSRGVGAACALQLAERGWDLVLNCSASEDDAREIGRRCEEFGAQAPLVVGSVAEDEVCRSICAQAQESFGRLDALVNNAGTTKFNPHGNLDGLDADDFHRIYGVNLVGPYQLTRAAEPLLRAAPDPSVIMVASIAGILGVGSSVAYAASKSALVGMTKSLARVMEGIRVNAVCPGFIQGEWLRQGLGEQVYDAGLKQWQQVSTLHDVCDAERVAQVIVQMIEGFPLITGEAILMDGGYSLGAQMGGARR